MIEAEKRERWDKELEEAHKRPSVLKSGPIQGCATLLALEVEALKAGKPVSSVVMPDFTAKAVKEPQGAPATPACEETRGTATDSQETRGNATDSEETSREGDFC